MALRPRKSKQKASPSHTSSQPAVSSKTGNQRASMPGFTDTLRRQPLWMVLAVSSGACAAFNGVFAKLTTTALTSTLSSHIATLFSLPPDNKLIDLGVRAFFFSMNLLFNAAMWALFTAALTRADSTTRVSIINVSANFMVTAILGWLVFGEKLPPLWWLGASLLAAGNVVIGRREEGEKPGGTVGLDETREEAENLLGNSETRDHHADLVELEYEQPQAQRREDNTRIDRGEDADDPL